MKVKHIVLILVVLLTLSMTTAAFAKQSGETFEGFVHVSTDLTACEIIIISAEDWENPEASDTETFTLPEDFVFDCTSVAIGDYIVIIGEWVIIDGEVLFVVEWIGPPDLEGGGEGEGKGAYCADENSKVHPLADKIVIKYGGIVDSAWVMVQFCRGFGFGEVMLAIQTQIAHPEDPVDDFGEAAEQWLNRRKAGQGWGQIWKEKKIVENDTTDHTGNGWLKKPDKVKGPKEGKGPDKGPDHPSNNSNRPDKENKNNKNKDDEGE